MEILRFDESDAPAPKKKRPSKGWLALGLVAALMGIGTAFASTSVGSKITINGNDKVPLSQGVATTVNCQSDDLNVVPTSQVYFPADSEDPYFYLKNLDISGVNSSCDGKDFKIQIFKPDVPSGGGIPTLIDCGSHTIGYQYGSGGSWSPITNDLEICDGSGAIFFRVRTGATNYRIVFVDPTPYEVKSEDFGYITVESTTYDYPA